MQLSKRVAGIAPSITLEIDAKAKAMQAQGLDVVGFGAGEPDFATPSFIREAGKQAIDAGKTKYTPASGAPDLRAAVCEKLARDNALAYKPEQIIISSGAKHSLFNAFQALINEGDEVIIPSPCWVSYPEMVRMAGGVPVFVPGLECDDFKPTIQAIAAAVSPRTRAFVLNTPNNPNGHVYTAAELAAIAGLAATHDFTVVSDEIYELLTYDGDCPPSIATLPGMIERTVVVNGVSKAYAMTGWRIGYTASPLPLAKAMGNFQSHATSAPATMCQAAATAALRGSMDEAIAMKAEFDRRRRLIHGLINAVPGLSARLPAGAFYIMMNISAVLGKSYEGRAIKGSMDFADALLQGEQCAVVPGLAFEADAYCRLSYATSLQNIEKGLARIAAFVGKLK